MNVLPKTLRGLGSMWLQEIWKRCWHRQVETCSSYDGDKEDCCRISNCDLCLEWTPDYDYVDNNTNKGIASPTGDHTHEGFVNSVLFKGEVENRDGDCLYVVYLDGVEVATFDFCQGSGYQEIQCHELQGSIPYLTLGSEEGTLTFYPYKPVDAKTIKGEVPDENGEGGTCGRHYCGQCKCAARDLCVTITNYDGEVFDQIYAGTISYDGGCEPSNAISYYGQVFVDGNDMTFDFDLVEGYYNECRYQGTINYNGVNYELDLELGDECHQIDLSFTITDDDYDVWLISIQTQRCGVCEGFSVTCCEDPIPRTLYVTFEQGPSPMTPGEEDCSCIDGHTIAIHNNQPQPIPIADGNWESGVVSHPCYGNDPYTVCPYMTVTLTCTGGVWTLAVGFTNEYGETDCGSTSTSPAVSGPEECEPVEIAFPDGVVETTVYVPGQCDSGLVPRPVTATVTE